MAMEEKQADICLRIPGKMEYALVIRTALGGVAVLEGLNVNAMDDLRTAADEACDCLLHQGRPVETITVTVVDAGERLTVRLDAAFSGSCNGLCADQTAISQAILETLIPEVKLTQDASGAVQQISLTLPKKA